VDGLSRASFPLGIAIEMLLTATHTLRIAIRKPWSAFLKLSIAALKLKTASFPLRFDFQKLKAAFHIV
jgi:hypothetical protein